MDKREGIWHFRLSFHIFTQYFALNTFKIEALKIKFDKQGLVPAIIQEYKTGNILMLAYMNEHSLEMSQETGFTHFWSRSRQCLWKKGETSGHFQQIESIAYDCDSDSLLITVKQSGQACHTGHKSCFYRSIGDAETAAYDAVNQLETVIDRHSRMSGDVSYTASLYKKGTDTILKKFGEEATELVIAAKGGKEKEIIYEAADLVYHFLVLLHYNKIRFYLCGELS